jgi:hypothetical protein
MDYVLDILQGAGLALACGLHPFMPVLLAGALASSELGLDFDGTAFAFLEQGWFLLLIAAALVASLLLRGRLVEGPGESAMSGLAIGFGALLCAASLDDRSDVWWPGLLAGAVCAALAAAATRSILARTRRRLDHQAAGALPLYAAGVSAVVAGLSIAGPPLALVAAGFFARLLAGGRRREGEKYAGLRILR